MYNRTALPSHRRWRFALALCGRIRVKGKSEDRRKSVHGHTWAAHGAADGPFPLPCFHYSVRREKVKNFILARVKPCLRRIARGQNILIFNTIICEKPIRVKIKNTIGGRMKIYDYEGRKNICGNRVHEARCRLRLTQSELAAQLQVAGVIIERDSVSRIEIGTRFVADYELRALSRILGVSPAWLLGAE